MAFKLFLIATIVAVASAGMTMDMMDMMNAYNKMKESENYEIPRTGDCKDGRCSIPQGVDVSSYIQSQKDDMKYKQEKMNADIKAQFESVMAEVTMKRHKYAMGIMTEYAAMCSCIDESNTLYDSQFLPGGAAANLTDVIAMPLPSAFPYDANTLKEAKLRIFAGLLRSSCGFLKTYMTFANQVEGQLAVLNSS